MPFCLPLCLTKFDSKAPFPDPPPPEPPYAPPCLPFDIFGRTLTLRFVTPFPATDASRASHLASIYAGLASSSDVETNLLQTLVGLSGLFPGGAPSAPTEGRLLQTTPTAACYGAGCRPATTVAMLEVAPALLPLLPPSALCAAFTTEAGLLLASGIAPDEHGVPVPFSCTRPPPPPPPLSPLSPPSAGCSLRWLFTTLLVFLILTFVLLLFFGTYLYVESAPKRAGPQVAMQVARVLRSAPSPPASPPASPPRVPPRASTPPAAHGRGRARVAMQASASESAATMPRRHYQPPALADGSPVTSPPRRAVPGSVPVSVSGSPCSSAIPAHHRRRFDPIEAHLGRAEEELAVFEVVLDTRRA